MATDSKPGYVYILTNPSFREDWVKIGKSGRPVDVRSKELDNTAVPLPFEIFATLKTTKYNEVEKLVHKTIDRLTDLRIRQNREFFNVRPDVALDILKDIASTLDDAEIETYVNGGLIHINKDTQRKDTDQSSATRSLKDAFWKGYNDVMRNNDEFNRYFTLHESLPRYSYDLRLGTSVCNIFQVAVKKKLTVGLYFHGKEQFRAFSLRRNEIESILGTAADWSEFDKDCSITLSRDFNLDDAKSYPAAYEWLLKKAISFKLAYEKGLVLIQEPITPVSSVDEEIEETSQNSEQKKTRPPFRFSMVGIQIGEELTFVPTGVKVRVASDDQIEYQGRLYKLSPFTGTFMPEDKRNTSGAYQGAKFFSYKGRILNDIRSEIEAQ